MAKRIQFSNHGDTTVLQYVDFTPSEPHDNEVLVANKAIGLNFIDTYIRSGLYPVDRLPSGLGTEGAGVVAKVGELVTDLQIGDRVAYCQAPLGAYADHHLVSANNLVKLPDNVSFEQAAASILKGLTVYYLLTKTYRIKANEKILFHAAAGGIGSIACQWAKIIGAKLIGTVGSADKVTQAKQDGAWQVINYRKENVAERILELTNNEKVDVVYDSVGKDMWLTSLDCLKKRGLLVSFGNSSGPVTGVNLAILNQKGSLYVTRPSMNAYITNKAEFKAATDEFFAYVATGAIKIEIREAQKFALKDAAKAHYRLENRLTIGPSILIP